MSSLAASSTNFKFSLNTNRLVSSSLRTSTRKFLLRSFRSSDWLTVEGEQHLAGEDGAERRVHPTQVPVLLRLIEDAWKVAVHSSRFFQSRQKLRSFFRPFLHLL